MGDLSESQQAMLDYFRNWIKEESITDHPQYDDYYLLRFLRARQFDWEKTKLMFTNFLEWRKTMEVDNILNVRNSMTQNILRPSNLMKLKK